VVTVCDNEYIRDVQALVAMARHFPSDRYPRTVFRHVALHAPDWEEIGLHRTEAICSLAAPVCSMNAGSSTNSPRSALFHRAAGADEAMPFSNVCQNRPRAGRSSIPRRRRAVRRHDYAIVQRSAITLNGQKVIVVVVAGGTSLGTLAAAKWDYYLSLGRGAQNRVQDCCGLGIPSTGPPGLRPPFRFGNGAQPRPPVEDPGRGEGPLPQQKPQCAQGSQPHFRGHGLRDPAHGQRRSLPPL